MDKTVTVFIQDGHRLVSINYRSVNPLQFPVAGREGSQQNVKVRVSFSPSTPFTVLS